MFPLCHRECPECNKFQPSWTALETDQVVAIDTSILFLQPGDLVSKRLSGCSKEMNEENKAHCYLWSRQIKMRTKTFCDSPVENFLFWPRTFLKKKKFKIKLLKWLFVYNHFKVNDKLMTCSWLIAAPFAWFLLSAVRITVLESRLSRSLFKGWKASSLRISDQMGLISGAESAALI